MNHRTSTPGSVRTPLIRGFALVIAAGVLLTGCAQKGPTSTSETVEGSSLGGGSTTAPTTGGTTSLGGSAEEKLTTFTVDGTDYSSTAPYKCTIMDDDISASAGVIASDVPYFSVMFTLGDESNALVSVYVDDFFGMNSSDGRPMNNTFDKAKSTFSVSGKLAALAGASEGEVVLEGTCKTI